MVVKVNARSPVLAARSFSIQPVYTIGVAANMLGVSTHSLRQYEREGLILVHKSDTGRRLYSELEIEKVRCIKKMVQEKGLNFEGIRRMFALLPCWKLRGCSSRVKRNCRFMGRTEGPCWASELKCGHPLEDCRTCPVYRSVGSCDDIKTLIYRSID